jgi:DNA-binding MarR family transcriptional regulator
LFVIAETGLRNGHDCWTYQNRIRKELGVSAPTVSKMLRALERDGFVRRSRLPFQDRRQVLVELTRKARGLLRRVYLKIIRPGVVWFALYTTFFMRGEDVGMLHDLCDELRRKLGHRAKFNYPWCKRTLSPRHRPIPASLARH